jgi:hypothetical protein
MLRRNGLASKTNNLVQKSRLLSAKSLELKNWNKNWQKKSITGLWKNKPFKMKPMPSAFMTLSKKGTLKH